MARWDQAAVGRWMEALAARDRAVFGLACAEIAAPGVPNVHPARAVCENALSRAWESVQSADGLQIEQLQGDVESLERIVDANEARPAERPWEDDAIASVYYGVRGAMNADVTDCVAAVGRAYCSVAERAGGDPRSLAASRFVDVIEELHDTVRTGSVMDSDGRLDRKAVEQIFRAARRHAAEAWPSQ